MKKKLKWSFLLAGTRWLLLLPFVIALRLTQGSKRELIQRIAEGKGLLGCWACWPVGLLAGLLSFPFFSSLFLFLFVSFQHQCCCRPLYLSFSSSLVPREASTCRLPALFLLYSRLPCELIKALLEPQSSVMQLERKDKLLGLVGFSGIWAFWACSL